MVLKGVLITVLSLSLIGCATSSINIVKPFVEPQYGMNKLQMVDLLGKPKRIEIYKKSDQTRIEFYVYVRKYESSQEEVPVCLIDNKVAGWGKTFYEDHVSTDDVRIK